MKILGTNRNSKCMYCNAEAYGRGCIYSPHKFHVHADDPKRCIYCGSTAFGNGCIYNPFAKVHVHGVEYNQMAKESFHKNVVASLLINKFFSENYNQNSNIDKFIHKIKKLLGENKLDFISDIALLETANSMNTKSDNSLINIENNKLFELKSNVILNELFDLINEYRCDENTDVDNILYKNMIEILKK